MGVEREQARLAAVATHQATRALQNLMGIVTGIVADGELTDKEVLFLSTWLREHDAISEQWPGSAIYRLVREVLADGIITNDERSHLLGKLQELVSNDFANTGSTLFEGPALPVDDDITVILADSDICHTGEFLYGTRAAVERATQKAGGSPVDSVTRKTDILVIGTRTSPQWVGTTFGRKIQKAQELRDAGTGIEIITERRWLQALGS